VRRGRQDYPGRVNPNFEESTLPSGRVIEGKKRGRNCYAPAPTIGSLVLGYFLVVKVQLYGEASASPVVDLIPVERLTRYVFFEPRVLLGLTVMVFEPSLYVGALVEAGTHFFLESL